MCVSVFVRQSIGRKQDFFKYDTYKGQNHLGEALALFDHVWILPIYPAREVPIDGVSSELLLNGDSRLELVLKEEVLSRISVKAPEVLVTLGAGDIANLSKLIQKLLEQ